MKMLNIIKKLFEEFDCDGGNTLDEAEIPLMLKSLLQHQRNLKQVHPSCSPLSFLFIVGSGSQLLVPLFPSCPVNWTHLNSMFLDHFWLSVLCRLGYPMTNWNEPVKSATTIIHTGSTRDTWLPEAAMPQPWPWPRKPSWQKSHQPVEKYHSWQNVMKCQYYRASVPNHLEVVDVYSSLLIKYVCETVQWDKKCMWGKECAWSHQLNELMFVCVFRSYDPETDVHYHSRYRWAPNFDAEDCA